MEDFDHPLSLSSLLCHEGDQSCLNENYDQDDEIFEPCSVSESDDDYIIKLFQKEAIFAECSTKNDQSCLNCARSEAIQWILNTRDFFGFHYRTAYLSLLYFDIFLSKRSIEDGKIWAIRLLSVACLSLAAKMEECKVPALSEYHVDEYNFEGNVIQKMELLVLTTLEWKLNLITPFAYLHYFIIKFHGESRRKELVLRATDLIFGMVKDVNFVENRPSIIAAAAVFAAYDYQLTRKILEIKMSLISSWGSIEKENILSCYSLLQKREMLKSKTLNSPDSPKLLTTKSSCVDVLENSSIISAIGTKRRLTYSDCDQHFPPSKIHRS